VVEFYDFKSFTKLRKDRVINQNFSFLIMKVTSCPAWLVASSLRRHGVLIRYYSTPRLVECIRISVGTPETTEKLKQVLDILDKQDDLAIYAKECDTLLWDLDGVIADVSDSYITAIISTSAHFGVVVTKDDIISAKLKGNTSTYSKLTHTLISSKGHKVSLEEVLLKFEQIYNGTNTTKGLWEREKVIPKLELLSTLSKKFKMGIVTDRPRLEAERFLNHFKLREYFGVAVCLEDVEKIKPAPDVLQKAIKLLNGNKAIVVGDNVDIMSAANFAGVLAFGALVVPGLNNSDGSILTSFGAFRILNDLEKLKILLNIQ